MLFSGQIKDKNISASIMEAWDQRLPDAEFVILRDESQKKKNSVIGGIDNMKSC